MAFSRKLISAIAPMLLASTLGYCQCLFEDSPPPQPLGGDGASSYASANGWYLPTKDTLRILLVLLEVNYATDSLDPTPPGGTTHWPAHSLPIWVNNPDPEVNLFDWDVNPGGATGLLTRYFQDASSNSFHVVADYLLAPDNGGIFQTSMNSIGSANAAVNAALGTTIATGHGFSNVSDFHSRWVSASGPSGLHSFIPST